MRVVYDDNGNFSFLFKKNEKQLGIDILLSLSFSTAEEYAIIDKAIVGIKYAGEPLPDNVVHIY